MKSVHVSIPEPIGKAIKGDERLILRASRHIIKEKLWEMKNQMEEAKEKINLFEEKYGVNFSGFEDKIKERMFSEHEHHEDYNEWFFWKEVLKRSRKTLSMYEKLIRVEKC